MPIIDLCASPSDTPQSSLRYEDDLTAPGAGVIDGQDKVEVGTESGCQRPTVEEFIIDAHGHYSNYGDTPQARLRTLQGVSGGKSVSTRLLALTAYSSVPRVVREGVEQVCDGAQNLLDGLKRVFP